MMSGRSGRSAPDEDVADYILLRPSLMGRPGVLPLQTLLIHRSLLEQVPFTTHKDHEDWAWLLEAWHVAGARVEFVWEPLVIYNIATESLSRSRRMNWRDSLAWAERYRKWIGMPGVQLLCDDEGGAEGEAGRGLARVEDDCGDGVAEQAGGAGSGVSGGRGPLLPGAMLCRLLGSVRWLQERRRDGARLMLGFG